MLFVNAVSVTTNSSYMLFVIAVSVTTNSSNMVFVNAVSVTTNSSYYKQQLLQTTVTFYL